MNQESRIKNQVAQAPAAQSDRPIVIAHLYPREMNIYGDLGNVVTLIRRLEWRGYRVEVEPVEIAKPYDLARPDIVFGGGGQDRGQTLIAADLIERGPALRQLAESGVPMLLVCGLYQLFGASFTTLEGEEIPGIGVFGVRTVAGQQRLIGNVVVESRWGRLVGFENHSGATQLLPGQEPLGRVVKGHGNAPRGGSEGAIVRNVVGTYLHGPVLPKNPKLADWLIARILERREITELAPLDDRLESQAAEVAAHRPQ